MLTVEFLEKHIDRIESWKKYNEAVKDSLDILKVKNDILQYQLDKMLEVHK